MPLSTSGPRALLRKLREVMAGQETAQKKLDKIVVIIAKNMEAGVCSVYIRRPGERLELYSTIGLKPDAVHKTTLAVGEGLVGQIAASAETLNLAEAQEHPNFAYKPETGEEKFHSFMGVPIVRAGISLGVLAVQNVNPKEYSEEEVEALQTAAMVMAEIVASGELPNVAAVIEDDITHIRSHRLHGNALSSGLALGHVVLHEPRVVIENMIAEDMEAEHERLDTAIQDLRFEIDRMFEPADTHRGGEYRDVLEAYRMFAHDEGWVAHMQEAIDTGLTAEAAVERVQNNNRARMMRSEDPYLRERLHDFDDLAHRLLRTLSGETDTAAAGRLPKDAIIVARNMGPAELLDYDRKHLRGVVLEEGSAHSHVTIVARALGVPMVGNVGSVLDMVDPETPIIVDGNSGEVYVRPSTDVEEIYADKARLGARRQAQYAKLKDKPSVTKDGVNIELHINVGLKVDLPQLCASGADGVGLFRTELQFMIASRLPRMDEQMAHYKSVLDSAGDRPVVFRSLDIGSDKFLPYLKHDREENPALGWRAIRMSLDRPAFIRLQLRALLRAAEGREIRIMFPMVSTVEEFKAAKQAVDLELEFLEKRNYKQPSKVHVGAMLEVPALLNQLDKLLPLLDFISVGSNDLFQFLFACDRANQRVAERYDVLSPSFLRTLREIVVKCEKENTPVSLCGEMAGNQIEAMALLAIGFRTISMAPASIGPVKDMIRKIKLSEIEKLVLPLLDKAGSSLRSELEAFAKSKKILMNS